MRKFLGFTCIVLSVVLSCGLSYIQAETTDIVDIQASYSLSESPVDFYSNFDYIFSAVVTELVQVKERSDSIDSYPLPISYFNVEVKKVYKGNISKNIIEIAFAGGEVDGTLYVLDKQSRRVSEYYPMIGQEYVFASNPSRTDNDLIGIENGDLFIERPESITDADYFDLDSINPQGEVATEYNIDFSNLDDGGSDSDIGESFNNPITLVEGIVNTVYTNGEPVFFKFSSSGQYTKIQSRYTFSGLDVDAYLYNYLQDPIIDDQSSGQGSNFLFEGFTTMNDYYVKVYPHFSFLNGTFEILVGEENLYCVNEESDLILSWNLINTQNQVVYRNNSAYISQVAYAIGVWDEMALVDFIQDTTTLMNTLTIIDVYWEGSFISGTASSSGFIKLNSWKLEPYLPGNEGNVVRTIMHELGHILGIAHMNADANNLITVHESYDNVMRQGSMPAWGIGPCDKSVYYFLYGDILQ